MVRSLFILSALFLVTSCKPMVINDKISKMIDRKVSNFESGFDSGSKSFDSGKIDIAVVDYSSFDSGSVVPPVNVIN